MYKPKCMPNNLSEQLKVSVYIIFLFNQLLSEETIWPHCLKLIANYPAPSARGAGSNVVKHEWNAKAFEISKFFLHRSFILISSK